jgi:hypothetical protein
MPIAKIISGGQTGADQGGLHAARDLGLETGGDMPVGYRTEIGRWDLATEFNMMTLANYEYTARTKSNVQNSDGTLCIGRHSTPGAHQTAMFCKKLGKPFLAVHWPEAALPLGSYLPQVLKWFSDHDIQTLNIAGNRESKNPGIFVVTRAFVIAAVGNYNSSSLVLEV